MKKAGMYIAIVVGLLLSVNLVSASQVLTPLFDTFANISIAEIYLRYASIIDFFLVLVIFGSIAKFSVGKLYGDSSNGLAVVVGLIMAISFSFMELKYGFVLGDLGWIAIMVFLAFLAFFLYNIMTGMGADPKFAGAVLFIISYAIIAGTIPQWFEWLNHTAEYSIGASLLVVLIHIVLITSVIKIIISVISGKNNFK